jgi:hypothetical protein
MKKAKKTKRKYTKKKMVSPSPSISTSLSPSASEPEAPKEYEEHKVIDLQTKAFRYFLKLVRVLANIEKGNTTDYYEDYNDEEDYEDY